MQSRIHDRFPEFCELILSITGNGRSGLHLIHGYGSLNLALDSGHLIEDFRKELLGGSYVVEAWEGRNNNEVCNRCGCSERLRYPSPAIDDNQLILTSEFLYFVT